MSVRRIVPDIHTRALGESRAFYRAPGLDEVMDLGWIVSFASSSVPTAQVGVATHDATAPVVPDISIGVDDVDAVHAAVCANGAEIVHPLRNEAWGVRRFFVRDPDGRVVNVLTHL
ncbi:VOC family protein [Nocardiopsis mangrovi]|uniref:VOC family protein n=1 Tax=Nocardiopsis mangrovi TaxID=1179818 RepID=A0ABV9DTR4_9ACTN